MVGIPLIVNAIVKPMPKDIENLIVHFPEEKPFGDKKDDNCLVVLLVPFVLFVGLINAGLVIGVTLINSGHSSKFLVIIVVFGASEALNHIVCDRNHEE